MTEKRFVFDPSIYHFTDTKTGKTYCEYNLDEVVELLNAFYEEKEQLKKALWEAEKSHIQETSTNSIRMERDLEYLQKEFEREYWKT